MKKFLLLAILGISGKMVVAQTSTNTDSIPAYQRIGVVPPFKLMVLPDSTAYTKEDLKKKKETIIMIFSPDCEHCIHSTEDLLKHYDLFKNVQIVMGTPLSYDHIQKFYTDYHIAAYPNIKVGIDNTYFLGQFYNVHSYPAIFVYDKKGNFKEFFDGSVKWEKIAKAL